MTDKKKNILYIVCAYGFFWFAILLIGLVMMLMGEGFQGSVPFRFMTAVAAWTPTLALFLLFKKIYPSSSVKEFYKNAFRECLNLKTLLLVALIQFIVFFGGVGIVAFISEVSFRSLLDLSIPTIAIGFAWTSIQGATGEESGWHSLQLQLEKKSGTIKSSLIVGMVWGLWHTPLWFTAGFTGLELIQYIMAFMVAIVSAAVIIGICFSRCKNMFVRIWIHFMFNFTLVMYTGAMLQMITVLAVLYMFVAVAYVIWHKRCSVV